LGEGDDPAMQLLKSLSVDYTLDGQTHQLIVLDGQIVRLGSCQNAVPIAQAHVADNGHPQLEAWQNGTYAATTASGRMLRCTVNDLPAAQRIAGPWEVRFPAQSTPEQKVTLDQLSSWSDHSDPQVRFFSGTATYRHTFRVASALLAPGRAVYLDLGQVAVIARVRVNGEDLGILWTRPFRMEVTKTLRAGDNTLEVEVTNLWVNRMIGDEQLPEDSARTADGLLTSWPQWLLEGKPSPTQRRTFATYRVWKKDSPLQESGLLGPVSLYVTQRVSLKTLP